ncbi:MAG: TlpA family protein disulfide reductase [Dehalococcoidia bacterium]
MTSPLMRLARPLLIAAVAAAGVLAVACGGGDATPKWDARSVGSSIRNAPFTPVIVNSNLGKGPTRLALALLKQDQTLVLEGEVTAKLFRIAEDPEQQPAQATAVGEYPLTARVIDIADHEQGHSRRLVPPDRDERGRTLGTIALRDTSTPAPAAPAHDGAMSAIFTTMVNFEESGRYGAQLTVKTGSKTYRNLLLTFIVLDKTAEPSVGDAAPKTKQKIAKDVSDLSEIDSSTKPNPQLHDITVADAIASGKPSIVAFVTPAFCQTRFCGPVVKNVVLPLSQEYAGRVHVMHIEPYDLPQARKGQLVAVDAALEWNLRAEPFIAVLDRQGRVTAKFEGIIDLSEVKDALETTLAAK